MNKYPVDWEVCQLSNLVDIKASSVDKKSREGHDQIQLCNYMDVFNNATINNSIAFMQSTASKREIKDFQLIKGDVLLTKDSEVPEEIGMPSVLIDNIDYLICGYHLYLLRIKNLVISPEYLCWTLRSTFSKKYFYKMANGSTRFGLNLEHVKQCLIPLPPYSEQKKINRILTSFTEVIGNTQNQIEKLQYLKQATLNELLTTGIGHKDYKVSELGKIPKTWQIKRFRDVCRVANGQVDPKIEPYSKMKHIGPGNIEKFTGRLLDVRTAKNDGQTSGKYLFKETDILYGKINPHFAKIAFPNYSGVCSADIYPINCNDDLKPAFLFYYLLSNEFTNYAVRVSGRTGMPKINREDLNLAKIRIPPIEEQIKISSILNSMDKAIRTKQRKLHKFYSLKQSMLQDLVTGKVRVKVY